MKALTLVTSLDEWAGHRPQRVVYTIGNFDGVHLGHRRLLDRLVTLARETDASPVVVTFRVHPQSVLDPAHARPHLTTHDERIEILSGMAIEWLVEPNFTPELSRLPAQAFLSLLAGYGAAGFVVGDDFRFGASRQGDAGTVSDFLATTGNGRLAIVPALVRGGERVSSSRIRALLESGDVETAALLLGRPYRTTGFRESGDGIGRTLGFPTINLGGIGNMIPGHGVYLAHCELADGGEYPAMVYIGTRPTYAGQQERLEVHLLASAPEVLPGDEVRIGFRARLRDERHFARREDLVAQLELDRAAALERWRAPE